MCSLASASFWIACTCSSWERPHRSRTSMARSNSQVSGVRERRMFRMESGCSLGLKIFSVFADEEISAMRRELDKYGIQMPAFSKIGGILANEVSGQFVFITYENTVHEVLIESWLEKKAASKHPQSCTLIILFVFRADACRWSRMYVGVLFSNLDMDLTCTARFACW